MQLTKFPSISKRSKKKAAAFSSKNTLPHLNLKKDEPCPHCGRFANRGVSIDAIIIKGGNVLLIHRGVEPHKEDWSTPGGYVGWDESTEETIRREVKEETNLDVKSVKLVGLQSSPNRHPKQVINIIYLVNADVTLKHGDDALDVKWFDLDNLSEKMAFDHRQIIEDAKK